MTKIRNHYASLFAWALAILLLFVVLGIALKHQVVESSPIVNLTRSQAREPITLAEAFLGELRAREFSFEWLAGDGPDDKDVGDQLIYEDSKNILLATLPSIERRSGSNQTGTQAKSNLQPDITVLVANSSLLASIEYQGFRISPSKRYLLLWNLRRKQFRHSSTAKYFLYDIKLDLITLLSTRSNVSEVDPGASFNIDDDPSRFQLVDWYPRKTPDGLVDSLILIQNNDIYNLFDVSRLATSYAASPEILMGRQDFWHAPARLTTTGINSVVFNGLPDWLYEEEILGDTPAFQVSPLADHLAYISFDDSHVNIMPFTIYGDRVIPRVQQIRYPKTGQPNPRVSVHVIENISSSADGGAVKDIQLILPDDLAREQHYINRITWLTNERLALIWSNRNQNNSHVVICSKLSEASTWTCEKNLNIKSENGWLDISDDLLPLDGSSYLALIPKFEGPDVGEFKHIARVSLTKPNSFVYLTSGRREVVMFNGIDYKRSLVYYTSTVVNEPGQRQLFVAELESNSKEALLTDTVNSNVSELSGSSVCVTCDHHPDSCLYNYARMSPTTNYYIYQCAGPGIPRTELRATRRRRHRNFQDQLVNDTRQRKFLNETQVDQATTDESTLNGQSSLVWTLEDNKELRERIVSNRLLPVTMRLKVPIPETPYLADVLLLLPPLESSYSQIDGQAQSKVASLEIYAFLLPIGQKFPMVVDVYGGPGSQKVDYRFNVNFGHYLATSKRTVYAMIDGRGSGYQGTKRLYELYHRLGTVEIQDQIYVSSELARTLPFIDPLKVAIWGWSYGGYAAAMSLAQSKMQYNQQLLALVANQTLANSTSLSVTLPHRVFKCAASVAPVTNWIYYDTAYTEKYMSSPWINEHYDESMPGDHSAHSQSDSGDINGTRGKQFPTNKWTPLNQTLNSLLVRPRHTRSQQLLELLVKSSDPNTTQAIVSQIKSDSQLSPTPPSSLSSHTSQNDDLNERYKKASLLDQMIHADSKHFLLMHGTADDNVNFQQSVMLMKRLIRKNILFEMRLYPDQDHGIANKADKYHLGTTLSDFLDGCFSES